MTNFTPFLIVSVLLNRSHNGSCDWEWKKGDNHVHFMKNNVNILLSMARQRWRKSSGLMTQQVLVLRLVQKMESGAKLDVLGQCQLLSQSPTIFRFKVAFLFQGSYSTFLSPQYAPVHSFTCFRWNNGCQNNTYSDNYLWMATSTTFSTLEFLVSVFTHTPECLPHQLSSTMAAKVGRVKQIEKGESHFKWMWICLHRWCFHHCKRRRGLRMNQYQGPV